MTQKNMKPTGLQTNLQGNHNTSTLQTNSSYLIQPSIQRSISVTSLINENSNNHSYAQGNSNYLSPNGGVFRMDNRQHLNSTNTCPNGLNMIGSMNSNYPPNFLTSVSSPNANHGNHHHHEVTKPKTKLEKFRDFIFKPNHSKHNKNVNTQFTSYLDGQPPNETNTNRQCKKSTDSLTDSIINNPSNVLASLDTVKIVAPSKTSEKFIMDLETKANVRDMFNKLDFEDQLKIQQRGLELLAEEYSRKLALFDDLKREINEKKRELDQIGQPIRSPLNIEKLRGEIRSLTNEKAELEYRISLDLKWPCKKCTCLNSNRLTKCTMCHTERDENELFLCMYCNTKNLLFNRNCTNCTAHFNSASLSRGPNISGSSNSINSTMSNLANTNSNLLTSRRSTGSSASPTPTPSPLHNSSSFLSSPFMPSLISSPQPNNNNSTSQYNPI